MLEEEGVPEAKWVGSQKENNKGAARVNNPDPEDPVLGLEDQGNTQDPNPQNPFAKEDAGVVEGRVREDDVGPGELARDDHECLRDGLRWALLWAHRWAWQGPAQGVR